jgi:two-component system, cell cycle response regulator
MDARERKTIRKLTTAIESFLENSTLQEHLSNGKSDADLVLLCRSIDRLVTATSHAIELQTATERHFFLAGRDSLTGLYSRDYFEEVLALHERGRQFPISIILAELDRLDDIGTRQGKGARDQLIRSTATVVQRVVRGGDVVARYGDDAFAMLLPKANMNAAGVILERIRELETEKNRESDGPMLGISIGMATADRPGTLGEARLLAEQRMREDREARQS